MIRWGSRRLTIAALLAGLCLSVAAPVGAQSGGSEAEFELISDSYALGSSVGHTVGLRGSVNASGWAVVRWGLTCSFSNDLLSEPGTLFGDERNLQARLVELGVIELPDEPDPDTGSRAYVPTAAYQDRFDALEFIIGGWSYYRPNCIQGGLGYVDNNCAFVPGGVPAGIQAPVRAVSGMWIVSHDVFQQGAHGGAGGYSFQCLEAYYEPGFTGAVLDQIHLVIPRVTLEAQVRGAVGSEIGAWYSVSEQDRGRDRFRDAFSISVPTRGDSIPADVVLWLEEIRWDVDGDGEADIVETCAPHQATEPPAAFDCGGSEAAPIGEFIFEYRGLYEPTVELQWDGYYVAHFHNFDQRGDFDTGDIVTSHTLVDYPVIEIRSSLDG